MTTAARLKRWLPLALLGGVIAGSFALGLNDYLNLETLRENRAALKALVETHAAVASIGFILIYAVIVAASLPGATVMTLAGGFLFGTWLGSALNVVGATAGATLLFLVARSAVGDGLRARAGPFVKRMEEGFRRDAFNYLLFLRLVPVFPFWVVNLVPAFLGMRLIPYVIATLIGIIPGGVVYTAFGAGLGDLFDAGAEANLKDVFTPTIILALVGLGVLSLVPIAVRRWRERARPPVDTV
ncbi:MAG: TVP38/TMEM64 family protein [Defluviicoccus sp.]|nr:TVP38/TMEM64 family protein [Defluviicoccus sp.]MDG4592629.1 TVP38/TMEM64 family protein [Defluviicoccus sp.]